MPIDHDTPLTQGHDAAPDRGAIKVPHRPRVANAYPRSRSSSTSSDASSEESNSSVASTNTAYSQHSLGDSEHELDTTASRQHASGSSSSSSSSLALSEDVTIQSRPLTHVDASAFNELPYRWLSSQAPDPFFPTDGYSSTALVGGDLSLTTRQHHPPELEHPQPRLPRDLAPLQYHSTLAALPDGLACVPIDGTKDCFLERVDSPLDRQSYADPWFVRRDVHQRPLTVNPASLITHPASQHTDSSPSVFLGNDVGTGRARDRLPSERLLIDRPPPNGAVSTQQQHLEASRHPRRRQTNASWNKPALVRQEQLTNNYVDRLIGESYLLPPRASGARADLKDVAISLVTYIWPGSIRDSRVAKVDEKSKLDGRCKTDGQSKTDDQGKPQATSSTSRLRYFLQQVLLRCKATHSILQTAMYYCTVLQCSGAISRAFDSALYSKGQGHPLHCGRRMFFASLMLASKQLLDKNYSSRAWAAISGLTTQDINKHERMFLDAIDYRTFIHVDTFNTWQQRTFKFADQILHGIHIPWAQVHTEMQACAKTNAQKTQLSAAKWPTDGIAYDVTPLAEQQRHMASLRYAKALYFDRLWPYGVTFAAANNLSAPSSLYSSGTALAYGSTIWPRRIVAESVQHALSLDVPAADTLLHESVTVLSTPRLPGAHSTIDAKEQDDARSADLAAVSTRILAICKSLPRIRPDTEPPLPAAPQLPVIDFDSSADTIPDDFSRFLQQTKQDSDSGYGSASPECIGHEQQSSPAIEAVAVIDVSSYVMPEVRIEEERPVVATKTGRDAFMATLALYDRARCELVKQLSLDPENPDVHRALSVLLMHLKAHGKLQFLDSEITSSNHHSPASPNPLLPIQAHSDSPAVKTEDNDSDDFSEDYAEKSEDYADYEDKALSHIEHRSSKHRPHVLPIRNKRKFTSDDVNPTRALRSGQKKFKTNLGAPRARTRARGA